MTGLWVPKAPSLPHLPESVTATTGTATGNLNEGGGVAAAFDGVTDQARTSGATDSTNMTGYVGKDWATTKAIQKAVVHSSNNAGFWGGGNYADTLLILQGSNDSTDGLDGNWDDLGTTPLFTDTSGLLVKTVNADAGVNVSAYAHHRVQLSSTVSQSYPSIGEVEFYEVGSTDQYGSNGCHLDFSDAAALGTDSSGNGNNWTLAGSPVQTSDTPTNNYATANPHQGFHPNTGYTDGNLTIDFTSGSPSAGTGISTIPMPTSGKYYVEMKRLGSAETYPAYAGLKLLNGDGTQYVQYAINGEVKASHGSYSAVHTGIGQEDVVSFAMDIDAGTVDIRHNDVVQATVNYPVAETLFVRAMSYTTGNNLQLNFGSMGFTYTPPSGFKSLCSADLPAPAILKSAEVADIVLREGTGATASVDSLLFAPDWVTAKNRDAAGSWTTVDAARGDENVIHLDSTGAEYAWSGSLSLNATGYDLGATSVNTAGDSFIDICLKAGVDQGFEIVTWNGDGVAGRTIEHNLGKVPTFIIVKCASSPDSWAIYHAALGATKNLQFTTDAAQIQTNRWNDTEPTGTHFTLGTSSKVNANGETYVAYLFTDSDIFKAFSFTGNLSADGPFVHLGGKPLAIPFLKNADAIYSWLNTDARREPANPIDQYLVADTTSAEVAAPYDIFQFVSTGFKVVTDVSPAVNGSGNLMVRLAVLESTNHSNAY